LGKPLSPEIKEKLRQSKTLEQIEWIRLLN
jgi:hypothetical protein